MRTLAEELRDLIHAAIATTGPGIDCGRVAEAVTPLIQPLIAEAEERGAAKVRESLRVAARHPHKGPNDTDASMLREASKRLRAGYEPGGSWTKQTVAQVAEAVADVIEVKP